MKNTIIGNKIGTVVNVMINGTFHTKRCNTEKIANEMYKEILETIQNPTDEAIEKIRGYLNEVIRIANKNGLEYEPETGNVYMGKFKTPIPKLIVETIERYHENDYPVQSIKNFWTLLMINPDKRVREDVYKFIQDHGFVITDNGYMVAYKSVDYMNEKTNDLPTFVSNAFLHVKKDWKSSPKKYVVYHELESDEYKITKETTFKNWNVKEKNILKVGNLNKLQKDIENLSKDDRTIFTDHYTHKMEIKLGEPVKMERKECDSDPRKDCSKGLHVGANAYVKNFHGRNNPILVCLVNPAHIIAVPDYDHSKMRVCEYFPFAVASRKEEGDIDIIEQPYFEMDYIAHEEKELSKRISEVQLEEKEAFDMQGNVDERSYDEVLNALEQRVIDLAYFKNQSS